MSINNKRLLEKKLQQQLQEFYHYEEKPEAIILSELLRLERTELPKTQHPHKTSFLDSSL